MRVQWIGGLLLGLGLAGCGSSGGGKADTGMSPRPDTNFPIPTDGLDAGPLLTPVDAQVDPECDEDAMGENYCIINSPGGNGTRVGRQNPVPYQTCKQ